MFQPQAFHVPIYLTGHKHIGPVVQHVEVGIIPGTSVDLCPDPATFLLGLLCCLLESCSVPAMEQETVVCNSSDHCHWCHVAGGRHWNSFEGCQGSEKPVLFLRIENAFHNL